MLMQLALLACAAGACRLLLWMLHCHQGDLLLCWQQYPAAPVQASWRL
jgi:hypothetical protein